jgi:hypothetical protein
MAYFLGDEGLGLWGSKVRYGMAVVTGRGLTSVLGAERAIVKVVLVLGWKLGNLEICRGKRER